MIDLRWVWREEPLTKKVLQWRQRIQVANYLPVTWTPWQDVRTEEEEKDADKQA
jgi:hypothetical protein